MANRVAFHSLLLVSKASAPVQERRSLQVIAPELPIAFDAENVEVDRPA